MEVCKHCPKRDDSADCVGCHTYAVEKRNSILKKIVVELSNIPHGSVCCSEHIALIEKAKKTLKELKYEQ